MKIATISGLFFLFYLSLAYQQEDVYEYLWAKSQDIANKTLRVHFLLQMQANELHAERFVNFILQDINYVLNVTNMLKYMLNVSYEPEDMRDFFKNSYKSYKAFSDSLLSDYRFEQTPVIHPTPAMQKYLSTYKKVMKEDPIYFAMALLPCSRLWAWLGQNLNILVTNVYYKWVKDNMTGHPEKHFKNLLNKYLNTTEKINRANDLFRRQMQNEYDFFNTS